MIIPWQDLAPETLDNLIESFVLREGTDYGEQERSLEQKVNDVKRQLKSGDVVLPARLQDGSLRTLRLRCGTTPDEAQKVLLNRLGLTLPQRLRRIDEVEAIEPEGQPTPTKGQLQSRLFVPNGPGASKNADLIAKLRNLG